MKPGRLTGFVPAKVIKSRLHKRAVTQFADKYGLVYFGYTNQRDDEHRLVRGLTVSASYRDNHYTVGSHDGYDIALVERVDTIRFPGKPDRSQEWLIMTFDLHARVDLPHTFLGLQAYGETFYAQLFTKFAQFAPAPLDMLPGYDTQFIQRYCLYAPPAQLLSAERLFSPPVAQTIMDKFGGLTIEVVDQCLYVYAEHQTANLPLLERMLKAGLWLARVFDAADY